MLLLSDAPDACRPLLADPTSWQPLEAARLTEDTRRLWRALGSGSSAWAAHTARASTEGGERVLVVLANAARSQFDHMNEILGAGGHLPDGFACVALAGSRFRGQRGRPWTALPGNLHLSLHLGLDLEAARHQVGLTVLPAVATARAIERLTEGRLAPRLKWVNDVWLDGRKVAGVLTATQLQGERLRHAVLGLGVNVAQAPDLPPSPHGASATSIAAHDAPSARSDAWAHLLALVLDEIDQGRASLLADAGADLLRAYRSRAAFLGRRVTIWPVEAPVASATGEPLAQGLVLALNDDLSLVIEGHPRPVHTGRMTLD